MFVTKITLNDHYFFQVDTATFGLDSQFLLKGMENSNVKSYFNFMVDAAVIFGAARKNAEHELRDSLQFEMNLAKVFIGRNSHIFFLY